MEKNEKFIKYVAIASLSEKRVLVDYSPLETKDSLTKFQNQSLPLIKKLELITLMPDDQYVDRNNKDFKGISTVDKNNKWCYLLFTNHEYPERLSAELLNILREKTIKQLNSRFHSGSSNNSNLDDIQMTIVELCRDFSDPSNMDKLYNCNKIIKNVTNDMKLNVRGLLDTNDSLSLLEGKSDKIKSLAEKYKSSSNEIYLRTRCQKWTTKAVIIGVGCLLLIYLIYTIFFKGKGDEKK